MRGRYEGKYEALYTHLRDREQPSETMTFGEIEALLDGQLPSSAKKYQAWWANQDRGQGLAWMRAGYRTSGLSIDDGRVTFLRADQPDPSTEQPWELEEKTSEPLTIAEAKARLANTLGIDPSQIEITIRA
jgi:hypothetical protein